jgi:hypothetical protein
MKVEVNLPMQEDNKSLARTKRILVQHLLIADQPLQSVYLEEACKKKDRKKILIQKMMV